MGGLALVLYGSPRATADLDFVAEARCREGLVEFLQGKGYETLHLSEGYSNHLHPDPPWGRIDVVYVDGPTGAWAWSQEISRLFPTPPRRATSEGWEPFSL